MHAHGATLKALRKKLAISKEEPDILLDTNPATVNRRESWKVQISRKFRVMGAKIRSLSISEARRVIQ